MSGALDPVQPELPLEIPAARPSSGPAGPGDQPTSAPAPSTIPDLPPSLYEQAWSRLRALPWARWRAQATPAIKTGAGQLGELVRVAVTRGTPYTIKLARATASAGLVRNFPARVATVLHVVGLPAVVLRTAIQATVAHRAGLRIEEVVFFRLEDPAGYTVYEAPGPLPTALSVAYLPAASLALLALVCLVPVSTPVALLHLPVTWLTWVQVWLGVSFAGHALPAYEESGPVAEQARLGVRAADPLALLTVVPLRVVALLTRSGGLLPAALGGLACWWVASLIGRL